MSNPAKDAAIKIYLQTLNKAYTWTADHPDAWGAAWSSAAGLPASITDVAAKVQAAIGPAEIEATIGAKLTGGILPTMATAFPCAQQRLDDLRLRTGNPHQRFVVIRRIDLVECRRRDLADAAELPDGFLCRLPYHDKPVDHAQRTRIKPLRVNRDHHQ